MSKSTIWRKIFVTIVFNNFLVAENVILACDGGFNLTNWVLMMSHSAEILLKNRSLRDVSWTKVEKDMKSFDSNESINLPLISLAIQSLTMEAIPGLCETVWSLTPCETI